MTGLYLGALLLSLAGLLVLDLRLKLFLFAAPARAAVVLVVGVAGFLAWDAAGVGLGIFFEGPTTWLVGIDLAPDVPLEELFFLILLCLSAMDAFLLAQRLLESRSSRTTDSRPEDGPTRRADRPGRADLRRSGARGREGT